MVGYRYLIDILYEVQEVSFNSELMMPVILATWEATIRRTTVQDQPVQIVWETPSPK
jgi:hypothetical protein